MKKYLRMLWGFKEDFFKVWGFFFILGIVGETPYTKIEMLIISFGVSFMVLHFFLLLAILLYNSKKTN